MNKKKAIQATISGSVQGVGYRLATLTKARKLNLTGWVKNTADGSVECFAQGNEEDINEFVIWLKKGPFLSRVENVIINKQRVFDYKIFEIRY